MNWHYTTVQYAALQALEISITDYIICDIVYHQSRAGTQPWEYTPKKLSELLNISDRTVYYIIDRCVQKGLMTHEDKKVCVTSAFVDAVYPSIKTAKIAPDGNATAKIAVPTAKIAVETAKIAVHHNNILNNNPDSLRESDTFESNNQVVDERDTTLVEVDEDGNEINRRKKMTWEDKQVNKKYKEMVMWAQERRGFPFTVVLKQYSAFKRAQQAGISPTRLKERWLDLENDSFWSAKGFDWADVVSTFNKRA